MKYIFACAVAIGAMAQTPPSEPAAGSLSGVVREAGARVPLEGVRVWAGGSDATTGSQGQFTIPKLEPGRHWVSVYDQARAASGGIYVLINPGQNLTGVEVYVKTGGSISGRVVDEDRHSVSGAPVVLLEAVFEFGRPAYRPELTAQTDRRGNYRLAPVPAERPFLILVKKPLQPIAADDSMPADPEKRPRLPMPAFYPGSPDLEGAQTVTLASSEDRRGVDIQMTSAPLYCIAGEILARDGTAVGSAVTEVTIAEQMPLVFRASFTPVSVKLAEGKFRACGFHPGEYRIAAANSEGSRTERWSASAPAIVTDRDRQDVQLSPAPAVTVSGDAVWDSEPIGKPAETRIRIGLSKSRDVTYADEPKSPGHMMAGFSYGGRIRVPGDFTLENTPVDDYTLDLREIPDGCYVKDATLDGAAVLHQPLRLTQSAGGRLHIALACDAGSLTARVTDRDGNPISHVHLYVMPEEAPSAAALHEVLKQADVENGWSEAVKPLPPGKYLALACDLEMDGTAEPVLKLWRARSKATEVEIGAGATVQLTLQIADFP
jgi:hypothetical protein